MAIRSSNKINPSFSMSSMTDLIFLLLIFFMITSTLISPNALNLKLPQSNNQVSATRPVTKVYIQDRQSQGYYYQIDKTATSINNLERQLQLKLRNIEPKDQVLSLHVDKSVPMEEVVKVMNIAGRNKYKVILATAPERR
ncbi:MAG: biopolymer transporter ExbD [Bacteroidales bacterium]|jgi:biopolymer transport protein ExbD|nr:biopolymer transporter ExbD [Bacteroidales bacterium]